MRICLVSLDYRPVRTSGLAIYAERLAARLRRAGHEVTVLASRRPGTSEEAVDEGVRVVRVPTGPTDWWGFGWRAAGWLRRQPAFDAVHFLSVHFAWAWRGPFVGGLFHSFRQRLRADGGRPDGLTPWDRAFHHGYYRLARIVAEGPCVRRARRLVALSPSIAQEFVEAYGLDPARVTLATEGIDPERFRPLPAGGRGESRILLHVGFKAPRKGLEYLAAALRHLPDCTLVLAGPWAGGYRRRVMEAAGEAASRIRELGWVPDEEVPALLSWADLVVLPSLVEGFGLPALEALACGTPVVATAGGSLEEIVGPCGRLVPPRDPEALRRAIADLLSGDLEELGRQARQRVLERFTEAEAAQAMEEAYTG